MEPNSEEKIMKAAIKEFAQFGFDGARIDRIAKKAGINKAMIYYYHKGKESLYEKILESLYRGLLEHLSTSIPEMRKPDEQIIAAIGAFMDHINGVDENFIRIMLREIASGGKYFTKLALPKLILPILTLMQGLIRKGKDQGLLKDIHDYYSFLTIVGAVVFFNAIRITIGETEIGKMLFSGNYRDDYKRNLLMIMTSGILK